MLTWVHVKLTLFFNGTFEAMPAAYEKEKKTLRLCKILSVPPHTSFLNSQWSTEVRAAWIEAYDLVCRGWIFSLTWKWKRQAFTAGIWQLNGTGVHSGLTLPIDHLLISLSKDESRHWQCHLSVLFLPDSLSKCPVNPSLPLLFCLLVLLLSSCSSSF